MDDNNDGNDDDKICHNHDTDVKCKNDLIVGAGWGERGRSRLGSAEGSAAELSKMSKYTEL